MADKISFTKKSLDRLVCPAGIDRCWAYDERTPSLALLTTERGAKSFYVYRRVNGRPQRIRLGGYPDITIEQAREEAAKVNGDIARGIDPQAEKRLARASMTLADLLKWYLEQAKAKKRTWADDKAQFERYFGKPPADRTEGYKPPESANWRTRKVSAISNADVESLHTSIVLKHGPYAANRLLALLSTMFNKAKLFNPAKGVERAEEEERERFLYPDEAARFFEAVASHHDASLRDFILLCILTGARRGNVQSMRWDEINLPRATWQIPKGKSKSKKQTTLHLPPAAIKILTGRWASHQGSPWVFAAKTKTGYLAEPYAKWQGIVKAAGLVDLRLHDLRRSLGSWQLSHGANLQIIGKSLGHTSQRATAIYARVQLDAVKQSVNAATGAMEQFMPAGLLPDEKPKK